MPNDITFLVKDQDNIVSKTIKYLDVFLDQIPSFQVEIKLKLAENGLRNKNYSRYTRFLSTQSTSASSQCLSP